MRDAFCVVAEPPSPKSHRYDSGVSPSGSDAVPVNATVSGAVPLIGLAMADTVGGVFEVGPPTPAPTKSTQLTLSSPPPLDTPTGGRATKNSGWVVVFAGRVTVTSV